MRHAGLARCDLAANYWAEPAQSHCPRTHEPVQQSPPRVHFAPKIAQVEPSVSQRAGLPAQVPAQHSSFVAHAAPAGMHADAQTGTPASFGVHAPWQHVSSAAQGAPRGRQGPAPNSQRDVVGSHPPQQGGTALPEQLSPAARQSAAASLHTPSGVAHCPEQQSLSAVHGSPEIVQSVFPHAPAVQPREQQSDAWLHGVPSTRQ